MSGEDKKTSGRSELRGAPLDVVRELLGEGRSDDVLAVVAALVSRNRELELLLAKMRESRNRGEHISAEQLALFTSIYPPARTPPRPGAAAPTATAASLRRCVVRGRPGRLPGRRREGNQVLFRHAAREAWKDVGQVLDGVDAEQGARRADRVRDGGALGAGV